MSDFVRYQHIERLGMCGNELDGLLEGEVYVFPKIDGANHCVYFDKDLNRVAIASRNQLLSEGYDSTGFWHFVKDHPEITEFVIRHPNLRLYGEYLTPHTIKNYADYAWNRWYIFDIWDDERAKWLSPVYCIDLIADVMKPQSQDITYIPWIARLKDPSMDDLMRCMDADDYLMKNGVRGQGEGIVIKNFYYLNPYGRRTWGKIVRESFKAKAYSKNKGEKKELPEEKSTAESISKEFVSKEFHKFTTDKGRVWSMSMTPDFLRYVWEEWWTDCSFSVLGNLDSVNLKAVRKTVSSCVMRLLNRIAIEGVR